MSKFVDFVRPEVSRKHMIHVLGNPATFYFCNVCGAHSDPERKLCDPYRLCSGTPARDEAGKMHGNAVRLIGPRGFRAGLTSHHPKYGKVSLGKTRRMCHGDVEYITAIWRPFET